MGTVPDLLLSVSLGIALAAATGLRVFLPLFLASVFAHFDVGGIGLREGFGWLSDWPAMLALGAHAQQQGVTKDEIVIGTIQDLSGPLAGFGAASGAI